MTVLVIGSGAGATQAARVLVRRGLAVHMIDVGGTSPYPDSTLPACDFSTLRRTDIDQSMYFLGKNFEGIQFGDLKSSHKLSPLKRHAIAEADSGSPVETDEFVMNRSRARGGLATGWGAGIATLGHHAFKAFPYGCAELAPYYEDVARHIGVSGEAEFGDVMPGFQTFQPPLELDTPNLAVLDRFTKRRAAFRKARFHLGRAWMAVCSMPMAGRDPCAYLDTEFWGDADSSVYRPEWTLRELERDRRFTYSAGLEAASFLETDRGVIVEARDVSTGEAARFEADAVVLGAGVPASAELALTSAKRFGESYSLPIRTNAHRYMPCLFPSMLGRQCQDRRSSLAQLSFLYENAGGPDGDVLFGNILSYRSMLTFKLLKEGPLPYRAGLRLLNSILPALLVVTVFHSDNGGGDKRIWIEEQRDSSAPHRIRIVYEESEANLRAQDKIERGLVKQIKRLGVLPIKRIRRAPGSSIHYSGTLPLSHDARDLTCDADGFLRPWSRVCVVDGSALPIMPAQLPTFTIMANAARTADRLCDRLEAKSKAV